MTQSGWSPLAAEADRQTTFVVRENKLVRAVEGAWLVMPRRGSRTFPT
jgi:hypothetical protein